MTGKTYFFPHDHHLFTTGGMWQRANSLNQGFRDEPEWDRVAGGPLDATQCIPAGSCNSTVVNPTAPTFTTVWR